MTIPTQLLPVAPQGLSIEGLAKRFAVNEGELVAIQDINLIIGLGEFVSIVGSSGCGKSTLLRIIAGLETHYEGRVRLGGKAVHGPGLDRGVVFQEHRLLPWLTVRGNVAFALADGAGDRGRALVDQHIELVGLKGFEDAYPHQLSGGMAQRAAIARALVNRPEILLLDEPFGLLDALTRIQLQQEILRIWEAERSTMVLVTHDIDEAVYLGDRVVVMSNRPGTVQKLFPVDLPRPRDRTCSDFVRIRKAVLREFFTEETSLPEYAI